MISQHGTLEISASRLRHNLQVFRERLPQKTRVCATVKANAYGHGIEAVVPVLVMAGVEWFAVYTLAEAEAVLERAPEAHVLVLAPLVAGTSAIEVSSRLLGLLLSGRVRVTLTDDYSAEELADFLLACGASKPVPVHVQVDCGLTRAGVSMEDAPRLFRKIRLLKHLQLEGVFAHLSHGEVAGHASLDEQSERLRRVCDTLKREQPELIVHLQNSGGGWNLRGYEYDMARLGIGLYGLQPWAEEPIRTLKPIARLVAPILAIHERPAGVGVGYNHTFTTAAPSRLAIVPVGYADGYPRALSNRGIVQVAGRAVPVVGRVSMDQIIVNVTDLDVRVGDVAVVISDDPTQDHSTDRIAATCGSIGYEIATGWGPRLARAVVK